MPDAYFDGLDPRDRAWRYTFGSPDPAAPHTLVAAVGDELVGFATVVVPAGSQLGELTALYVAPEHWDRRVGLALITAARARLVAAGCRSARLWLLAGNRRAERFYRRDGWEPDGSQRQRVVWGIEVAKSGFCRALP